MKCKLTILMAILLSTSLNLEARQGGVVGGGRGIRGPGIRPASARPAVN